MLHFRSSIIFLDKTASQRLASAKKMSGMAEKKGQP
jgi:hypothetical protein